MDLIESFADDPRIAVRDGATIDPHGRCIIYWMRRAQRAYENPALEAAIALANAIAKPVVVFFALRTHHPYATARHFTFMLEGLADTAARLERRRVVIVLVLRLRQIAEQFSPRVGGERRAFLLRVRGDHQQSQC